jgi:hypothetical protein
VNSTFYRKLIYQEISDTKYNGFLKASSRDSKHIEISRLKEEDKRQSTLQVNIMLYIVDALLLTLNFLNSLLS